MRKVIVTGANGFVGSWLVQELLRGGVQVVAVVKGCGSDLSALPHCDALRVVYCDADAVAAYEALPALLPDRDIECFFHLAWVGSAGPARGDHRLQLRNAAWAADAARAAGVLGCKRFVGAGSLAEHDCAAYIPQPDAKPNPVSCYGTAKIAAHYCTKAVCAQAGVEHIWAWLPNTYGEGNRTGNFVNFAALRMLKGERAAFTSGEQRYEFVYAADTAKGLCAMAEHGKPFHPYYIGGQPRPLRQYIEAIRDAIDPAITLHLGEVLFQGVPQPPEVFDASPLLADTGFAVGTSFAEGIRRTVAWLHEELEKGAL